jgi:hypothetical protein
MVLSLIGALSARTTPVLVLVLPAHIQPTVREL